MSIVDYYEGKLAEAAAKGGEDDYLALDQGRERTAERHKVFIDILGAAIKGKHLLDYGCGTALLLDGLHINECMPSQYTGIDILDRSDSVEKRCTSYPDILSYQFLQTDEDVPVTPLPKADVCTAIGVIGYWGGHTYRHAAAMLTALANSAPVGGCIFPMQTEGLLGEDVLHRFDIEDMQLFLTHCGILEDDDPDRFKMAKLEREFILFWGV